MGQTMAKAQMALAGDLELLSPQSITFGLEARNRELHLAARLVDGESAIGEHLHALVGPGGDALRVLRTAEASGYEAAAAEGRD